MGWFVWSSLSSRLCLIIFPCVSLKFKNFDVYDYKLHILCLYVVKCCVDCFVRCEPNLKSSLRLLIEILMKLVNRKFSQQQQIIRQ